MRCSYCGGPFTPLRSDAVACSKRCSTAFKNLEMVRAKRLYRALYHWHMWKSSSKATLMGVKDNLRFICREIRQWRDEDMKRQRPAPPRHDHMADRGHQRESAV